MVARRGELESYDTGIDSLGMGGYGDIQGTGLIDGTEMSRQMLGQIKIEEPEEFKDIVRLDTAKKFRLLTMAEIEVEQQKLILQTAEEQQVSKTLARMLLIKNGWDPAKVAKSLAEDPEYVFHTFNFRVSQPAVAEDLMCPCCYEDVTESSMMKMEDCGHWLCEDCFTGHCQEKLKQGPEVVTAACPDHTCRAIVSESTFKRALTVEEFAKYKKFLREHFASEREEARWCPTRDCDQAIVTTDGKLAAVSCKCGETYCFGCGEAPHAPLDCDLLESWCEKI